jgi:hypothetical protein
MSNRLHHHQIPELCFEISSLLLSKTSEPGKAPVSNYIFVEEEDLENFKLHLKNIFTAYVKQDQHLTNIARERVPKKAFTEEYDVAEMLKIKKDLATKENFPINDEMPKYLVDNVVQMLSNDSAVSDIFVEDDLIRRKLMPIILNTVRGSETHHVQVEQYKYQIKKVTMKWDSYLDLARNEIYTLAEKLEIGTFND